MSVLGLLLLLSSGIAAGQPCFDIPQILHATAIETAPIGTVLATLSVAMDGVTLTLDPALNEPPGYLVLKTASDKQQIILNQSLSLNELNDWHMPIPLTDEELNCTHNSSFTPSSPCEALKRTLSYFLRCSHVDGYEVPDNKVVLAVEEVNEYPPNFHCSPYYKHISELTPVGMTVFQLRDLAYDPDTEGGISAYNLQDGGSGVFELTAYMNEKLVVTAMLDYDSGVTVYNLNVSVQDTQSPPRSSWTTIHVFVEDADDQNPHFPNQHHRLQLTEQDENVLTREFVTMPPVFAYDQDIGINAEINYRITDGHIVNQAEYFAMNRTTGFLSVRKVLDREVVATFHLTIQAYQADQPAGRTDVAYVTVTVLDVNDNRPVMAQDDYNVTIPEHAHRGFTVTKVMGWDEDEGDNAVFEYYMEDSTGLFEIAPDSGELRVLNADLLDREITSQLQVKVFARETLTKEKHRSNSSTVTIVLSDINDNNPIYSQEGNYIFYLPSSLARGDFMGQVLAADTDEGRNGHVLYSIYSQQPYVMIRVDAITGLMYADNDISTDSGTSVQTLMQATDQAVRRTDRRSVFAAVRFTFTDDILSSHAPPNPGDTSTAKFTEVTTQAPPTTRGQTCPYDTTQILPSQGDSQSLLVGLLAAVIVLCIVTILLLVLCPRRFLVHRVDKSSSTESEDSGTQPTQRDTAVLLDHGLFPPVIHHAPCQLGMKSNETIQSLTHTAPEHGLMGTEENSEVGEITHNLLYELNENLCQVLDLEDMDRDFVSGTDHIEPHTRDMASRGASASPTSNAPSYSECKTYNESPKSENNEESLSISEISSIPSRPARPNFDFSRVPGLALLDKIVAAEGSSNPSSRAPSERGDAAEAEIARGSPDDDAKKVTVMGELPNSPRREMDENYVDHTFFINQ